MNPAQILIARMRSQRQSWVDLEPGKRVQIIRPPESQLVDFTTSAGLSQSDMVQIILRRSERYVTGWEGFTEADLVGAAGSGDAIEFTPELWAEVVADKVDWIAAINNALVASITPRPIHGSARPSPDAGQSGAGFQRASYATCPCARG